MTYQPTTIPTYSTRTVYTVNYTVDGKPAHATFETYERAQHFQEQLTHPDVARIQAEQIARNKVLSRPITSPDKGAYLFSQQKSKPAYSVLMVPLSERLTTTPQILKELDKNAETTLRSLEKEANWTRDTHPYTAHTGTTPSELVARVKHLSLSALMGGAKALPYIIAGTVGGPIVGGLLASSAAVSLASNFGATSTYIKAHPEEFAATLLGAVAAGYSVTKIKSVYTKYKTSITIKQRRLIEDELDKMIDDIAYKEQNMGAKFPTERPKGVYSPDQIKAWNSDSFDQYMAESFFSKNPEAFKKWVLEQNTAILIRGAGSSKKYFTQQELIMENPTLRQPWVNPSQFQIDRLTSDFYNKIPKTSLKPLYYGVMAIVARQGYITESQLKSLINQNTLLLQQAGQSASTITTQSIDTITLQTTIQETDKIYKNTSKDEKLKFGLPSRESQLKQLYFDTPTSKPSIFTVIFTYPNNHERYRLKSKSFKGAYLTANRLRRIDKTPIKVEVKKN